MIVVATWKQTAKYVIINAPSDEGPHRPDRGRRLEPGIERGAGLGDGAGVLPPLQTEAGHPRPFPEYVTIFYGFSYGTNLHLAKNYDFRSHGH